MYNVLIVEDDPMVAMINTQYVCRNKEFCVINSCKNGRDALNFLESSANSDSEKKIDLIIMDVFMPYLNGIETLKKIREKKISSEVIMVTAANDPATLEEAMYLGVIDFLIKPFAYERFQVALEKFAAKKEALRGATSTIDQDYVDSLISNSSQQGLQTSNLGGSGLPKGIQQKTLEVIKKYLNETSTWISGDTIAEEVGLSSVTIRHYMNYLVNQKYVKETINYETGGRPSMLYKIR